MVNREFGGPPPVDIKNEQRINLSEKECDDYLNKNINDPELHKWMDEKGIQFDQGMIKVSLDGVDHLLCTDKNDFGTMSYADDKTGYDLAKEEKEKK